MSKNKNKDQKRLLKKNRPEIKRANITLRWLYQVVMEPEDLSLISTVSDDETVDNKYELPMVSVRGEDKMPPSLVSMGIWEITQDFPIKLSG